MKNRLCRNNFKIKENVKNLSKYLQEYQNFILFTIDITKKYMLLYILIREVYYGNKNNI